jgi:hypothetical protein
MCNVKSCHVRATSWMDKHGRITSTVLFVMIVAATVPSLSTVRLHMLHISTEITAMQMQQCTHFALLCYTSLSIMLLYWVHVASNNKKLLTTSCKAPGIFVQFLSNLHFVEIFQYKSPAQNFMKMHPLVAQLIPYIRTDGWADRPTCRHHEPMD